MTQNNPIYSKIQTSSIVQWMLYFVLFCASFITHPTAETDYILGRIHQFIVCFIFLFLLIYWINDNKLKIPVFDSNINLFFAFVWIVSITSHTLWITWTYNWICAMTILLSANLFWKKNPTQSFFILACIGSFITYLNAILVFMFPEGLYTDEQGQLQYLFGNYNAIGSISLLSILFQGIYTTHTGKGNINLLLLISVSIVVCAFLGSMTSTVGLVILLLYTLLRKRIKHIYWFVIPFLIVYIFFMISIVIIGNSIDNISFISAFITNVLGKNTTFTHRTSVWLEYLQYIKQSPWIGCGAQTLEVTLRLSGDSSVVKGAHNIWLAIVFNGGLVGLCIFLNAMRMSLLSAKKCPNSTTRYSIAVLCILLLMSLFEQYSWIVIFGILITTYYSQWFNQQTLVNTSETPLSQTNNYSSI